MDPRDEEISRRHQPYDVELEQAIIGTMLSINRMVDVISADVEARHFYDPMHGRLYEMIVHLQTEGAVTPLILHSVMKADLGLKDVGGIEYLNSIYAAAPLIPRMREYGSVLLELAMRRELLAISQDIRDGVFERPTDDWTAQKIADRATEAMLQAGRSIAPEPLTAHQIAMESLKNCERVAHGEKIPMVRTGLEKVDSELGGLRGGDLVIILGKSGMGKSAMLGSVSRFTAMVEIPTLVFTLEMRSQQWVERMICDMDFDSALEVGAKPMWYSRVRNGRLSTDEFNRFYTAADKLHGLPIEIVEADDLTILQIQSKARAFKAKWGKDEDGKDRIGLIVVDYVQIVEPTDQRDNRERQVAKIARGLKSLAKRLNWVVIAGSQTNENDTARGKEEKRPQASDARESKSIMNEADVMFAPFRPAYFVENRKPMDGVTGDTAWTEWNEELKRVRNKFELLMLKNRHGRRLDFDLYCDMGASAIRDNPPRGTNAMKDDVTEDLLRGL